MRDARSPGSPRAGGRRRRQSTARARSRAQQPAAACPPVGHRVVAVGRGRTSRTSIRASRRALRTAGRVRIGERVAAQGGVRGLAREDPLDRHLEHLARQRPRHGGYGPYLVGHVPRRAVLTDPCAGCATRSSSSADTSRSATAWHVPLPRAAGRPRALADDAVQGQHCAVDLGRAHPDPAAVDRRVGASGDDGGPRSVISIQSPWRQTPGKVSK